MEPTDADKALTVLQVNFRKAYNVCNHETVTLDDWLGLVCYSDYQFTQIKKLVLVAWPNKRFLMREATLGHASIYISIHCMFDFPEENCLKYVRSAYDKIQIRRQKTEIRIAEIRHKALMERINKKK